MSSFVYVINLIEGDALTRLTAILALMSGAGLLPIVIAWIHAACSCTQSHTCILSLTFAADLNSTHAPGKQDSTPPDIN